MLLSFHKISVWFKNFHSTPVENYCYDTNRYQKFTTDICSLSKIFEIFVIFNFRERDTTSMQEELQLQLEEAKNVIADKVLFNDTSKFRILLILSN